MNNEHWNNIIYASINGDLQTIIRIMHMTCYREDFLDAHLYNSYITSTQSNIHLYTAISNGHLDIVHYFISLGIIFNEKHALKLAILTGRLRIIKYLVDHGTDIYASEFLMYASRHCHPEIVKYLIKHGHRYRGDTDRAAVNAVINDRLPVVKYFVEEQSRHIDIQILYNTASEYGHQEIMQFLDSYRCSDSALRSAIRNGHLEIVKYLVCKNSISMTSKLGQECLHIAVDMQDVHVVKYLVSRWEKEMSIIK